MHFSLLNFPLLAACLLTCSASNNVDSKELKAEGRGVSGQNQAADNARGGGKANGTEEPVSPPDPKQIGPTPQEEDLLELMVRIAGTPEEWERIHRVLTELNKEEAAAKKKQEQPTHNNTVVHSQNITISQDSPRVMDHKSQSTNFDNGRSFNETNGNIINTKLSDEETKTTAYPTVYKKKIQKEWRKGKSGSIKQKTKAKKNGDWPSLEDIMLQVHKKELSQRLIKSNKVRKNARPTKVNDEFSSDRNLDQNLSDGINSKRNQETHPTIKPDLLPTGKLKPKPQKTWPNFTYHRVTSSPNDHRNAYVAVSVVDRRKSSVVTTPSLPETRQNKSGHHMPPWNHARHLRKLQEQLKALSAAKARLRHRWLEKEKLQEALLTELSETA